jgi:hypothetical protein
MAWPDWRRPSFPSCRQAGTVRYGPGWSITIVPASLRRVGSMLSRPAEDELEAAVGLVEHLAAGPRAGQVVCGATKAFVKELSLKGRAAVVVDPVDRTVVRLPRRVIRRLYTWGPAPPQRLLSRPAPLKPGRGLV